ncbi:MAG TPA: hypothetical protein VK711_14235 [Puia sp.]|nr:hypothetical protein [Puia sp.]
MNWKLPSFLVIALYFFPFLSPAQMIDSMMNVYSEKFPQEKIYMQFDKKAYNPGDRIWYKAYLFTGFDPSPFSKIFYAELYDAYGNLILRNSEPIIESAAIGNFDLPSSFDGTRIHIRAYTSWMLNFDTSFIYTKDLRIIGSLQDSSTHMIPTATSLHFFPEGGELVAGIENNIAFRANDSFDLPRKVSGILYDQSGKALLNFNSAHDGMGNFILIPDKADVFYAIWKDEKGIEHRTELPPVRSSGIVLRVLNSKQKLIFNVARPAESLANQQVTIIGHMNQQIVYKAVVSLKENTMSGGNIPTDQLPTGILEITIFDLNLLPLAERVCFINNNNYSFDGKLTLSAKSLQKRGRNVVDVDITDTFKSKLAIAITDAEVDGNRPWDDNIISSLLLTGDLHGYVKDPYYYFQNNSDSLIRQLDLVMLTHGWRRFKWENLVNGKLPVIKYPIENYLSINAEVLGIPSSRISKDESLNVVFQTKGASTSMLNVPYVNNSKFSLSGLIFYDTAKAYYMFNTNRGLSNEAAIIFKNGLSAGVKKLKPFNMTLPVWSPDDSSLIRKSRQVFEEIARLNGDKKVQNLEAVTVRRRIRIKSDKEKLDEEYSSGLFSGGNATIFDLVNDQTVSAVDIFTYLQGRVAGLQINTAGSTPSLTWRGSSPGIFLNEIQSDAGSVKNIPVSDIAMVKVFSPGSAGGMSNSAGGVISIYTKKGTDKKPDPSIKGLDMVRILGFNVQREFYSPDYLINPEPESDDIRTTLYWNPNLKAGKGIRRISIPFYNSDVTHKFRIILEGFNDDGKLIHLEKIVD